MPTPQDSPQPLVGDNKPGDEPDSGSDSLTEVGLQPSTLLSGSNLINSYALVTYIPDPLGAFLDELRRELVPDCIPHAHVTILPPRGLSLPAEEAWRLIRYRAEAFPAFEIEADDIQVFENTTVAYIAVGKGWQQLIELHDALAQGPLWSAEPFPYHPHITVAQDFAPDQLGQIAERARRRWAEFPHRRAFWVDSVTFVQATSDNRWLDLAWCRLAAARR